jgi:hypothetical protein
MLKELRDETKYDVVLKKVIENVKKEGYTEIRAAVADREMPAKLVSQNNDDIFIPDVTAQSKYGGKAYFEIAKKIGETTKLVNKWKLLSTLAEIKNGIFRIFVPHGAMRFTRELVNRYNINAEVVKI